jgi:DNA polymerase-4
VPEATLVGALGRAAGAHLHALAWARDDRPVEPDRAPKSIGHEETYARDHHERASLQREAVRLADSVAGRLRAQGLAGRTVTLKVRFHDFRTITRARTLPTPVDEGRAIASVARDLLDEVDPSPGVRLLGVSVSNLRAGGRQLRLDEAETGWGETSRAVDDIRRRFGAAAVGPASAVDERGLRVKRRGDQQWGPGEEPPSASRSEGRWGPA